MVASGKFLFDIEVFTIDVRGTEKMCGEDLRIIKLTI